MGSDDLEKYFVSFYVYLPKDIPQDQVREWIRAHLGTGECIWALNPLVTQNLKDYIKGITVIG